MEAFVVIALIAVALVLAELVLPTGGALAAIGAIGLIASGVVALTSDSSAAEYAGPALIAYASVLCSAVVICATWPLRCQRSTKLCGWACLLMASVVSRSNL